MKYNYDLHIVPTPERGNDAVSLFQLDGVAS